MSREAKRQKENQIIMRAAHLESENGELKSTMKNVSEENDIIRKDIKKLSKRLAKYQVKEENFPFSN